jgi:hypothetical protein
MNEYLMLQQMFQGFGGGTLAWSYAVYLAGMFVVLLWRKENIVSWGLYRASYLLFAGALALPPVITPVLSMTMSGVMGRGGMGQADVSVLFTIFSSGLGPALFAGAVVCGLGSMMPRRVYNLPPPGAQQQHPLD